MRGKRRVNFSPQLNFVAMLLGSVFGAYFAVRLPLTRLEEQIKAQAARIEDHAKRIERLEGEYFKG